MRMMESASAITTKFGMNKSLCVFATATWFGTQQIKPVSVREIKYGSFTSTGARVDLEYGTMIKRYANAELI